MMLVTCFFPFVYLMFITKVDTNRYINSSLLFIIKVETKKNKHPPKIKLTKKQTKKEPKLRK